MHTNVVLRSSLRGGTWHGRLSASAVAVAAYILSFPFSACATKVTGMIVHDKLHEIHYLLHRKFVMRVIYVLRRHLLSLIVKHDCAQKMSPKPITNSHQEKRIVTAETVIL